MADSRVVAAVRAATVMADSGGAGPAPEFDLTRPVDHTAVNIDPVWGTDPEKPDVDTFHFTNCSPQHEVPIAHLIDRTGLDAAGDHVRIDGYADLVV